MNLWIVVCVFLHMYVCVCVSYPDIDSCNTMATFAFALTEAVFCWLLVLWDQMLYTGQLRYS